MSHHATPAPPGLGSELSRAKRAGQADRSPLQVVPHDHLLQLHDIGVAKAQEQGDLSKAADGDPCNQTWPQQTPLTAGTPAASHLSEPPACPRQASATPNPKTVRALPATSGEPRPSQQAPLTPFPRHVPGCSSEGPLARRAGPERRALCPQAARAVWGTQRLLARTWWGRPVAGPGGESGDR